MSQADAFIQVLTSHLKDNQLLGSKVGDTEKGAHFTMHNEVTSHVFHLCFQIIFLYETNWIWSFSGCLSHCSDVSHHNASFHG